MTETQSLEQKAFDDLDDIDELSEEALVHLSRGDLDSVEQVLRLINDTASAWEDEQ